MDISECQEKKRKPYPTAAQKARLMARLKNDSDLSKGKYSSTFSKNEAERRWNDIADELNAIPGAVKTWIEWRKTWQDMKCSLKKKKKPKVQNVTNYPVSMLPDYFINEDESLTGHEPANVEHQDTSNTPRLMIELEGNGNTVSVSCAKKESISADTTCAKTLNESTRSTFLKNRRYSYDYFSQDNVCRLCWSTTNSTRSMENDTATTKKILENVGVDVSIGTPKTVCMLCIIKIESFIKFRRLCQEADRKLKIILSNTTSQNINPEKQLSDFDDDNFSDDTFSKDDNYCASCDITFESAEEITKHNIEKHKNEPKSFECYGCNETFNHKLKRCKNTMEYSCINCRTYVPTKLNVKKVKYKEPLTVYKCQICSEIFRIRLLWTKHMAVHREEIKFVCEVSRLLETSRHISLEHGGETVFQRRPNKMLHPEASEDVHSTVVVGQVSPQRTHEASLPMG